jgi:hypothetical protein
MNGAFPFIYGLLVDLVTTSPLEEARWRGARALVQLTYANPYSSWCIASNAGREARARRRELEARAIQLDAELHRGAADARDIAAVRRELEECRRMAREVRLHMLIVTPFPRARDVLLLLSLLLFRSHAIR